MTTRWRPSARNELPGRRSQVELLRSVQDPADSRSLCFRPVLLTLPNLKRTRSDEDSPVRDSFRPRSLLRPVIGGVLFATACLYISDLDFTATAEKGRHGFPKEGLRTDSDAAVLNPPRDSYPFDPGGRNVEDKKPLHRMSSQHLGLRLSPGRSTEKAIAAGCAGFSRPLEFTKDSWTPVRVPWHLRGNERTLVRLCRLQSREKERPAMGGEGNGYFGDVPGYDRSKQREESLGHDVHALQTLAIDASKDSFGKDPAGDGGSSDLGDKGLRFFDSGDVQAVREAVSRYATFANAVLSADEQAVREGKQPQGRYIVLEAKNELVNRLRGVLSGFLLGMLTDRVFVAEISYQKDGTKGLLSALFEGPGYEIRNGRCMALASASIGAEAMGTNPASPSCACRILFGGSSSTGTSRPGSKWDLSRLPMELRRELKPSLAHSLEFGMKEGDFHRWVCEDVLGSRLSSSRVVTLSTVVYPLPLLARNPTYASHPLLAGSDAAGDGGGVKREGFSSGKQARIEVLETLLTRMVLRPTGELRKRASDLATLVRSKAAAWGASQGMDRPPRVVGLHIRTYFVEAISQGSIQDDLRQYAACASQGRDRGSDAGDDERSPFFFVATDTAATQELAKRTWGDRCIFVDFSLPGSKREGILSAFVDLLVMGSLDDYVMTPHSSFSELGSSLSYTWLPVDDDEALRTLPNRPLVPIFPHMDVFERLKVRSLLDRRAQLTDAGREEGGECMRLHTAGMSLAIAKGKHIKSMFEAIETAACLKGRAGIADV